MLTTVKFAVLSGGVGGARFLLGLQQLCHLGQFNSHHSPSHEVTAIVNVGDDVWLHGLRICPDLDTCMYTLAGVVNSESGWGYAHETWSTQNELHAYGIQPDWFPLGDRDLATHLIRTQSLRAGYSLTQVTTALCQRWPLEATLLPVTDDSAETHVVITNPNDHTQQAIHFQEWWLRYKAQVPTHGFGLVGAEKATISPQARTAITEADVILIAPSNPVVSIGTIIGIPGVRSALRSAQAPIIGYCPIIGTKPIRGMADICLSVIGIDSTAQGVGNYYGARSRTGFLDYWMIHSDDYAEIDGVEVCATPLLMTDPSATAAMIAAGLACAGISLD